MKKYQVFVSSTYQDLIKERQAVMWQIQSMGHFAVGMEAFPSSDSNAWHVIKNVIDNSDYYVLILANRYGSEAPDGLSWTEKEYDYAHGKGIPVLAFISANQPEVNPSVDRNRDAEQKLAEFRKKVEDNHTRTTWANTDQLKANVASGLSVQINVTPGEGWVRAGQMDSQDDLLKQINTLRIQKEDSDRTSDRLKAQLDHLAGGTFNESNYASGGESLEIVYQIQSASEKTDKTANVTWDVIFGFVAKKIFYGAEPYEIRDQLREDLAAYLHGDDEVGGLVSFQQKLTEKVVIQFEALNLVELHIIQSPQGSQALQFAYDSDPITRIYRLTPQGKKKFFDSKAAISNSPVNNALPV